MAIAYAGTSARFRGFEEFIVCVATSCIFLGNQFKNYIHYKDTYRLWFFYYLLERDTYDTILVTQLAFKLPFCPFLSNMQKKPFGSKTDRETQKDMETQKCS